MSPTFSADRARIKVGAFGSCARLSLIDPPQCFYSNIRSTYSQTTIQIHAQVCSSLIMSSSTSHFPGMPGSPPPLPEDPLARKRESLTIVLSIPLTHLPGQLRKLKLKHRLLVVLRQLRLVKKLVDELIQVSLPSSTRPSRRSTRLQAQRRRRN